MFYPFVLQIIMLLVISVYLTSNDMQNRSITFTKDLTTAQMETIFNKEKIVVNAIQKYIEQNFKSPTNFNDLNNTLPTTFINDNGFGQQFSFTISNNRDVNITHTITDNKILALYSNYYLGKLSGYAPIINGNNVIHNYTLRSQSQYALIPCPNNYVNIPKSQNTYGSTKGWCISKYLMTPYNNTGWVQENNNGMEYNSTIKIDSRISNSVNNYPIIYITYNEALTACNSLLVDNTGNSLYNARLPYFSEIRKISNAIVEQNISWSSNNIGSGYVSRGYSDTANTLLPPNRADNADATVTLGNPTTIYSKRIFKLNENETIHDVTGNLYQIFYEKNNGDGNLSYFDNGTRTFNGKNIAPLYGNSVNGLGKIFGPNGTGTTTSAYMSVFAGAYDSGDISGIYSINMDRNDPNMRNKRIGFRCVVSK